MAILKIICFRTISNVVLQTEARVPGRVENPGPILDNLTGVCKVLYIMVLCRQRVIHTPNIGTHTIGKRLEKSLWSQEATSQSTIKRV
jgi:hypothetical protein